ncbi:MAG: hypothetical protein NC349_02630 [Paenibacillus sp.]|nr:hypothetical protein [Paenibacillus sp.]
MRIIRYVACMAVAVMMAMAATSCGNVKDKAMDMAIEEINKQLEGQTMPGIEKMSLSADDNYVIYNYVVDEEQVDINEMKSTADQQKAEVMKSVVRDPNQKKFVEMVKLADRGMKFSYKGNKSGEGYEIVIEQDEL